MGGTSREQMSEAFGAYVRSQRQLARLTLRQAAELASISNPYLSQIEHGLSLPSIAVIRALADALSVSAETLLLRAAGIASPPSGERTNLTEKAIRQDSRLDDGQKQAMLAVLAAFVRSSDYGALAAPAQPGKQSHAGSPAQPGTTVQGEGAQPDAAAQSDGVGGAAPLAAAASPGTAPESQPTGIRGVARKRTSGRPATAGAVSSRRRRNDLE